MSTKSVKTECLSNEVLSQLLSGSADAQTEHHVEHCSACQEKLEQLTGPAPADSMSDRQQQLWRKALSGEVSDRTLRSSIPTPTNDTLFASDTAESIRTGPAIFPDLAEYEFLGKIAAGGMGVVYRAHHRRLGRDVAIKVMRTSDTQDYAIRFQREMKAVGQLSHLNIVQAFDAGEVDGVPYLVMELIHGHDLNQYVRSSTPDSSDDNVEAASLSITDACRYVCQAAAGLRAAHNSGLVHRDIKPSNLMLTHDGNVKILDLGLAGFEVADVAVEQITDEITIMGSLDYMAPEQGRDAHAATVTSDVYSLGCTLFALLTGRPPFTGSEYTTASQKLLAHACDGRPTVRQFRPTVSSGLDHAVQWMMSIAPADRPQSAAEVSELLFPFCEEGQVASSPWNATAVTISVGLMILTGVAIAAAAGLFTVPRNETSTLPARPTEVGIEAARSPTPPHDIESRETEIPHTFAVDYTSETSLSGISAKPVGTLTARVARQMFDGEVYWLQYSTDGSVLYLTGPGNAVQALDPLTGETIRRYAGHQIESRSLVFNNDQSTMYSTDDKGNILQHNVATATLEREVAELPNSLRELDLSPDQCTLAGPVENNGGLFLIDVRSGSYRGFDGDYQNCYFDGTGEFLYVSQRGVGLVRLNVETGQTEVIVELSDGTFGFLTAQATTDQVTFVEPSNRVTLLKMSTGEQTLSFETQPSDRHRARFSPSGKLLVIGPRSDTATVFGTDDGQMLASLTIPSSGSFRVFRFAPDEQSLAVGMNEGRLVIFDLGESLRAESSDAETEPHRLGNHGVTSSQLENTGTWPADAPPAAVVPFDTAAAVRHQQEWADYVGVSVVQENSLGIPMCLIPPGEFQMGATAEQIDESIEQLEKSLGDYLGETRLQMCRSATPQHKVRLPNVLLMSVCEITVEEYCRMTGLNPADAATWLRFFEDDQAPEVAPDFPAMVTWTDAVHFCNRLSEQENLPAYYQIDQEDNVTTLHNEGYRLPTEAEWEFACRSGSDDRIWTNGTDTDIENYAWTMQSEGGLARVESVRQKLPNGFGIYDMHGNVAEWCNDFFGLDAYTQATINDPQGPDTGHLRCRRGSDRGSRRCFVGNWVRSMGQSKSSGGGIRLVRTLDVPAKKQRNKD